MKISDYRHKLDVNINIHKEHVAMGKIGALIEVYEKSVTNPYVLSDGVSYFNQDMPKSYYDCIYTIEFGISHDVVSRAGLLFLTQAYQSLMAHYDYALVKRRLLNHLANWSVVALTVVNLKEAVYQSNNCPNARLT